MAEGWSAGVDGLIEALGKLVDAADAGLFGVTVVELRDLFRAVWERATGFREWLVVSGSGVSAVTLRMELNNNMRALRSMRDGLAGGWAQGANTGEVVQAIERCIALAEELRQSLAAGAPSTFSGPPVASPMADAVVGEFSLQDFTRAGGEPPLAPFTMVSVLYATDREEVSDAKTGRGFTAKRAGTGELTYGECAVSIPATHKLGKMESPSILRLEFRPDPARHIVLQGVTTIAEHAFLAMVRKRVTESPAKDAFIFVHGYNVAFADAARRTGQFAFDLGFVGAAILYSWPSNGVVADYGSDEANVIWTVPHLQRLLALLNAHSGAERIHLIAHSMGNRCVCDALKGLSDKPGELKLPLLHRLVLAAPDIDADTLREIGAAICSVAGSVTLYASSRDKAIQASGRWHKYPRAGGIPLLLVPGFETIDASGVETDFLAHSYFADSWPLLADIYEVLSGDKPASGRFALRAASSAAGSWFAFKA